MKRVSDEANAVQVERICISVNTRCNYGCRYCYFYSPENRISPGQPLRAADIRHILEQAFEYHVHHGFFKPVKINFVGSGEPLLNWGEIAEAVSLFWTAHADQRRLKFYTVTNGSLITPKIAEEMKSLRIIPSVSLDGPKDIHDSHRLLTTGEGSFEATMKGISALRNAGIGLAINTTLTKVLMLNLTSYLAFVTEQGIEKVIFNRLVDSPAEIETPSGADYYNFLTDVAALAQERKLPGLEIGNLEAYGRNLSGCPEQVCTLFGSSCGAGTNFLIYMGKDVYPCGRMFGKTEWRLGTHEHSIEYLQKQMRDRVLESKECLTCKVAVSCVRNCLLDQVSPDYECQSRQDFLHSFENVVFEGRGGRYDSEHLWHFGCGKDSSMQCY